MITMATNHSILQYQIQLLASNLTVSNSSNYEVFDVDDEGEYTPYGERAETYIVPALFALIFIVGVLGNGTLVIIFLRHRAMRNVPNTYIFSLALADLLVIVICVPFASLIYTLESWPWGGPACRILEGAKDVSIGVSVFTLTALSAERYCAIVNPLKRLQTRPMTVLSATLIWILAIVCAMPDVLLSDAVPISLGPNMTIIVCSPYPNGEFQDTYTKCNVVLKAIIYYWLPLVVIGAFYVPVALRLRASTRQLPAEPHAAQARARKNVACMVLAFVVVFFVCFLPYHVFMLWFHLTPTAQDDFNEWWHALRIVGFCLSFLNSCVNPIALYCISGVYRQHFDRYLCCRKIPSRSRLSRSVGTGASFRPTRASRRDTLVDSVPLTVYEEPPRAATIRRKPPPGNGMVTEVTLVSINEDGRYSSTIGKSQQIGFDMR